MRHVCVVSGKGGTGKTSLSAFWGAQLKNHAMVDADVDASNLPLVFSGEVTERNVYVGGNVALVDQDACTQCGLCADSCRFDAIRVTVDNRGKRYEVDPLACESCTLCSLVCPEDAISMIAHEAGEWFVTQTRFGPLVHAQLTVAEGNSGKLVTQVRKAAERIVAETGLDMILIDGPPGIGCQTTAALNGVDLAVVVTEPTTSGRHDMERILAVINRLNIPALVVINKIDLAPFYEELIRTSASRYGAEMVGTVPFIEGFSRAMAMGTLIDHPPAGLPERMQDLWDQIERRIPEQVY